MWRRLQREFTIGRNASCSLSLQHVSVSKVHCKILFSADGIYLQDLRSVHANEPAGTGLPRLFLRGLRSSFGTWLNRGAVIGKDNVVPLRNGDELSLILPRSRHMVRDAASATPLRAAYHPRCPCRCLVTTTSALCFKTCHVPRGVRASGF